MGARRGTATDGGGHMLPRRVLGEGLALKDMRLPPSTGSKAVNKCVLRAWAGAMWLGESTGNDVEKRRQEWEV